MPEADSGLMASARRLLFTFTSIVSTRLELLANELHEERLRLAQMLIFLLSALFCLGMGVLLLTTLFVVLFWDNHRIAVLGVMSIFFFVSGALIVMLLRSKAEAGSRLFSASLAELRKDREQLGADREQ